MSQIVTKFIADHAVTNIKLAQMPAFTIKGNNTGSTANAMDLTVSQAQVLLAIPTSSSPLPVNAGGTGLSSLTANSVLIGNGSSSPTFVAPGTSGNILTSNGTTWISSAASASGITQLTGDVTAGPGSGSQVASLVATSNATLTTLSALTTASSLASVGTVTSGTWNATTIAIAHGGTGQTTAAAAFAALSPLTTAGDIIYENSTPAPARLPIGSTGQVLTVVGGLPAWATSTVGANQSLSNLTSPTAINQDLIFNTGAPAFLKTKDDAAATQNLTIESGDATGGISGNLILQSGISDTQTGDVSLLSGAPSAPNINSGALSLLSGNVTGTGNSGVSELGSGSSVNGNSGNVSMLSGNASGSGDSGNINIASGIANATGSLNLSSGNTNAANFNSGSIALSTGTVSGTGVRGQIQFVDGSEGTAGQVWTSTDVNGSGHWAAPAPSGVNRKDTFVLSPTDITNQFVTLAHTPLANSTSLLVQGGGDQLEGASYDYTVSGATIVFQNGLATGGVSALVSGDVLQVQYEY